jgi:uncharacterized SAM-binding protein YcdF (DUF218 family)
MMDSLAAFTKTFLLPGSASFLLTAVTAGLVMLAVGRTRRLGRWILTLIVLLYWALSLPAVCDWLGRTLPGVLATRAMPAAPPRAIVVLAAGVSRNGDSTMSDAVVVPLEQTTLNAIQAARLYAQQGPLPVIASGGCNDCAVEPPESATLRQLLIARGVPPDRIVEESTSRTTREQALAVAPIVRAHAWNPVFLVTAPVHLLRARGAFNNAGVDVIPMPAAPHSSGTTFGQRWTPSPDALESSQKSMYDYLGYFYYWSRGWLRPPR